MGSMVAFALGNVVAASAHGYGMLLAARIIMALAASTFMPAASAYAAAVASPERRGRALSVIYVGLTLSTVIGVPLGVLVGGRFGWRDTFAGVFLLSVLAVTTAGRSTTRSPPSRAPAVELHLSEPERPRAVAAPVGARAGRGRHGRRLRRARLRARAIDAVARLLGSAPGRRPRRGAAYDRLVSPPRADESRCPADGGRRRGSAGCRQPRDAGCDALLVTKLENVRYLTGFTGSAAMLLVTARLGAARTDGRYQDQAAAAARGGGRRRPGSRSAAGEASSARSPAALRGPPAASASRRHDVSWSPAAPVRRRCSARRARRRPRGARRGACAS